MCFNHTIYDTLHQYTFSNTIVPRFPSSSTCCLRWQAFFFSLSLISSPFIFRHSSLKYYYLSVIKNITLSPFNSQFLSIVISINVIVVPYLPQYLWQALFHGMLLALNFVVSVYHCHIHLLYLTNECEFYINIPITHFALHNDFHIYSSMCK